MEPDVFMIWKCAPFFVEIQCLVYSDKVMREKVRCYENYYFSNEWQKEAWQPQNNKIFPPVSMITETPYRLSSSNVKFYQVTHITELIQMSKPNHQEIKVSGTSLKLIK